MTRRPNINDLAIAAQWLSIYEAAAGDAAIESIRRVEKWMQEMIEAEELRVACKAAGVRLSDVRRGLAARADKAGE